MMVCDIQLKKYTFRHQCLRFEVKRNANRCIFVYQCSVGTTDIIQQKLGRAG